MVGRETVNIFRHSRDSNQEVRPLSRQQQQQQQLQQLQQQQQQQQHQQHDGTLKKNMSAVRQVGTSNF